MTLTIFVVVTGAFGQTPRAPSKGTGRNVEIIIESPKPAAKKSLWAQIPTPPPGLVFADVTTLSRIGKTAKFHGYIELNRQQPSAGGAGVEIWADCGSSPWMTSVKLDSETGEPVKSPVEKDTSAEQWAIFGCAPDFYQPWYGYANLDEAVKRALVLQGGGFNDSALFGSLDPATASNIDKSRFKEWFEFTRSYTVTAIAITAVTKSTSEKPDMALQRAQGAADQLRHLGFGGLVKWVGVAERTDLGDLGLMITISVETEPLHPTASEIVESGRVPGIWDRFNPEAVSWFQCKTSYASNGQTVNSEALFAASTEHAWRYGKEVNRSYDFMGSMNPFNIREMTRGAPPPADPQAFLRELRACTEVSREYVNRMAPWARKSMSLDSPSR